MFKINTHSHHQINISHNVNKIKAVLAKTISDVQKSTNNEEKDNPESPMRKR